MIVPLLRIASHNVNGLRAWSERVKISDLLHRLELDVLCLQETKLQVGSSSVPDHVEGYESFWNSSRSKKGYSGTAIYVREGMTVNAWDWFQGGGEEEDCSCCHCVVLKSEGRVLMIDVSDFILINVYIPNGGKEVAAGNKDAPMKMEFLRRLRRQIDLFHAQGRRVVLVGDFNIISSNMDIWYDDVRYEREVRLGGEPCLSQSMGNWLRNLLNVNDADDGGGMMIDSFRYLHPNDRMYTWFNMKQNDARSLNRGWRLDYALCSREMQERIALADILSLEHGFSDHTPVLLALRHYQGPSSLPQKPLPLSSKYKSIQQPTIASFFTKKQKINEK